MEHNYVVRINEDKWEWVTALSKIVDMKRSELFRHYIGCSQNGVIFNEMFPNVSGQIGKVHAALK